MKERRPYRPRDPKLTSAIMAAVRGKNNRAEVALRKELWRRGLRYRLYDKRLPGCPDIVFRSARVAVFVDGDYWHGRAFIENGLAGLRRVFRTERRAYWIAKIKRNVERDRRTSADLLDLGWRVVRVWESGVLKDVVAMADRVASSL